VKQGKHHATGTTFGFINFLTSKNSMAKLKFDGVIEAVHYNEDGQVNWVRAFLRRGPTWSDRILIDRTKLLEQIKAGKRYVAGRRVSKLAGTFEVNGLIQRVERSGGEFLVIGANQSDKDCLEGVPLV
jgi:hypothetical protein